MSTRTDKVASEIKAICATELERRRPSAKSLLTVTAVSVTPDLRAATVYVSFLNVADSQIADLITEYQPGLQAAVAKQLKSKFTPRLQLKTDTSGEYAAHIARKLREL